MTSKVAARRAAFGGAVLLAGCCVLVTACSGSGPSSASSGSPGFGVAHAPAMPASKGLAASANGGLSRASGQSAVQTAGLAPASQSIIYTASLTIRSANVAATARQAIAIVVAAGGYTADEQAGATSGGKTGETINLTLKVPVPSYQTVLGQLSAPALGKQLSMQQQATDVTQEVANVNSLVTSQQDAIAALQGLLKRAGSVADLLQVQQQISQDESTLNSLLAQQRALDHETSYATVSMTLVSPHRHAQHKVTKHGFLAGLAAGWRALRHATAWVLTALGAAVPFLIIAAVLAGIGYAGRRRVVRRRAGPTAAE